MGSTGSAGATGPMGAPGSGLNLLRVDQIASDQVYNPPNGATMIFVQCWGGGGAGGGVNTNPVNQYWIGCGGGGGGYCEGWLVAGSYTVVVGLRGVGGFGTGGDGTDTFFAGGAFAALHGTGGLSATFPVNETFMVAGGGVGGNFGSANPNLTFGAQGTAGQNALFVFSPFLSPFGQQGGASGSGNGNYQPLTIGAPYQAVSAGVGGNGAFTGSVASRGGDGGPGLVIVQAFG